MIIYQDYVVSATESFISNNLIVLSLPVGGALTTVFALCEAVSHYFA